MESVRAGSGGIWGDDTQVIAKKRKSVDGAGKGSCRLASATGTDEEHAPVVESDTAGVHEDLTRGGYPRPDRDVAWLRQQVTGFESFRRQQQCKPGAFTRIKTLDQRRRPAHKNN
jgi:hypothetical protein